MERRIQRRNKGRYAYFGGCEVSSLFFLSGGPDPVVCGGVVWGVDGC
jgi:hypothetical protein